MLNGKGSWKTVMWLLIGLLVMAIVALLVGCQCRFAKVGKTIVADCRCALYDSTNGKNWNVTDPNTGIVLSYGSEFEEQYPKADIHVEVDPASKSLKLKTGEGVK
jgi:hypothetical protein